MFDIDNLIIPKLQQRLDEFKSINSQVAFLLNFLDYAIKFPDDEAEISRYCKARCNEVYDLSKIHRVWTDREFIKRYGIRMNSVIKTKKLINALCNDLLEDMGEYDEIIAKANEAISVFQDVEKMEFLGDRNKKTSDNNNKSKLSRVLDMKTKVGG